MGILVGNMIQIRLKGHNFKVGYLKDKGQFSCTFTCIPENKEGEEWLKEGDNYLDLFYKSRIDMGFAVNIPLLENEDEFNGEGESTDSEIREQQEEGPVRTELDSFAV